MDETYKRSIRKAHYRGMGKARTREEQKEIRERSRQRKSENTDRGRSRRQGWDDDEDAGFERMVRAKERAPLNSSRAAKDAAPSGPVEAPAGTVVGLVVSVARGRVSVALEGETFDLPLARALAEAQQGAIAVGDEAYVEHARTDTARVVGVAERRTVLSRPDPGDPRRELVLAANVDLGVVVVTPEGGTAKLALVDRFLVALQRGGIGAVVCVNKADLFDEPGERARMEQALEPYRELGLAALLVSAADGEGVPELRGLLQTRTCVFVGQSGVGKSSLLNALDPEGQRVVRETRVGDGKGRHTTTASSLTGLTDGTSVIDTPGIRQFGLWRIGREEVLDAFPEIAEEGASCRFADCSHVHEPQCGVRAAVERGELSRARYESYARLIAGLE